MDSRRFAQIREVRQVIAKKFDEKYLSNEDFLKKFGLDGEEYFGGKERLVVDFRRACLRVLVSREMYKLDVCEEWKSEVLKRQVNRYYEFFKSDKKVNGHVEAHHGIQPCDEKVDWVLKRGGVPFEPKTVEIAKKCENWMVLKRSRDFVDVNCLPNGKFTWNRTKGRIITKEFNLNAVLAQRAFIREFLADEDFNFGRRKHLAIFLHGKKDDRGVEFEVGNRVDYLLENDQLIVKKLLDEEVVRKVKKIMEKKIFELGIRGLNGELARVNLAKEGTFYCGSDALMRMKYGDKIFDFGGFGENFQVLQLECGVNVLKKYSDEIAEMVRSLIGEKF